MIPLDKFPGYQPHSKVEKTEIQGNLQRKGCDSEAASPECEPSSALCYR